MTDKLCDLIILFRKLCAEVENGDISTSEFIRQVNESAVEDELSPGCWWTISYSTGQWMYYTERTGWIVKAPQGLPLMAGEPPHYAPKSAAVPSAPIPRTHSRGGMPVWVVIIITIPAFFILMTAFSVCVVPSMQNAMNRSSQATSLSNVVQLGQFVDRYIQDHPEFGCPKASTIFELQEILEDAGINYNENLIKDGWGYYLVYESDDSISRRLFSITSYGSDGQKGPNVYPDFKGERIVKYFEQDIIYSSGRLTQYPEGASTSIR